MPQRDEASVWSAVRAALRGTAVPRLAAGLALSFSVTFSISLALLRPIAIGHEYGLAIACTIFLAALAVWHRWPRPFFHNAWVLGAAFVAAGIVGFLKLAALPATLPDHCEIIRVYASVFELLDQGLNPYVVPGVYHADAAGQAVWGTFNYPPLEILPFWLARQITGQWDATIFIGTVLTLDIAALAVLRRTLPEVPLWKLAAYFPALVLLNLHTNVALTFLFVVLVLHRLVTQARNPHGRQRWVLWALLGLGLNAKFLIIPLAATCWWHGVRFDRTRTLAGAAADLLIMAGVAVVVMAPFGVPEVWRSTVLFNLQLDERAVMTTYYPNVVSALFYLLDGRPLYPFFAVALFGAAVAAGSRLSFGGALLAACVAFQLVVPTPEFQYMPVLLCLALVVAHAPDVFGGHHAARWLVPEPAISRCPPGWTLRGQ